MAIRTIRNGRIRLNGTVFAPDETHIAYDGRLDGLQMVFYECDSEMQRLLGRGRLAVLEGRVGDHFGWVHESEPGPQIVDGCYPWYFWYELLRATDTA